MQKIFLALLLPTMLLGCASHYVVPSSVPLTRATFRIDVRDKAQAYLFTYKNRECQGNQWIDALQTQGKNTKLETTVQIPAEQDFIGYIRQDRSWFDGLSARQSFCGITYSFKPEVGQEYLIESGWKNATCTVDVYRLDASRPNGRRLEPSVVIEPKQCNY